MKMPNGINGTDANDHLRLSLSVSLSSHSPSPFIH